MCLKVINLKAFQFKSGIVLFFIALFFVNFSFAQDNSSKAPSNNSAAHLPVFKMWLGAGLPEMQAFDRAVVESALENSREKFGDYHFVTEVAVNTIKRQERIFHFSSDISINVSPVNTLYNDRPEGGYLMVPHPIAKGILGYRLLLVRKERLEEFRRIKTLKDLQQYSIGQVSGWADVAVLQENNIDVRAITKYELLFPMLNNKRFDSISVGCSEIPALTKFLDQYYPDKFAFVPDLVIFYPFSLYIFINRDQSTAIERLTYGYEQAYKKGDIDKLFDLYLGDLIKMLKTPNLKIIQLKNTQMSAKGADTFPKLLE